MALDAAFLKAVADELRQNILEYKVDKIHQPAKDEVILQLRGYSKAVSLALSANASNARAHITEHRRENPQSPPMFCMLLRKHLQGGKLIRIDQPDFERILRFTFSVYNEFSELVEKTIVVEIMGRHSNIILLGEQNRIIDAVCHVDFTVSRQRQILPGLTYDSPPAQGKKNPLAIQKEELENILSSREEMRVGKFLLEHFSGLSPLILREVVFRSGLDADMSMASMSDTAKEALARQFMQMVERIKTGTVTPVMLIESAGNKAKDFSFQNILQYGTMMQEITYESFSVLLDHYYEKRDKDERVRQKTQDILKVVNNAISRTAKKYNLQKTELMQARDRGQLKLYADLIMANLHQMEKGMETIRVQNYYSEDLAEVEIPLDNRLSPSQNAQKYYKEYAKAKTREAYLVEQIRQADTDIDYLESVLENLLKAENEREFLEIRDELSSQGYIKKKRQTGKNNKTKAQAQTQPMKFCSDDQYTILVGKNNLQNDRLTLKTASKYDLWLHTKAIAGSHTVIVSQGGEIPLRTITQAAILAATYSKAKTSRNVEVDYTVIKNVKKPAGAKPGMVIYDPYETAVVNPDEDLAKRLRCDA